MSTAEILRFPQPESPQVLPEWVTDRVERRALTRWAKSHVLHTAAYHSIRAPKYAGRLASYAPIGFGRSLVGALRWASDWDSRPVRQSIISTKDASHFVQAEKFHSQRVKFRATTLGIGSLVAVTAGSVLAMHAPGVEQLGAGAASLATLGWVGRPREARILDAAHLPSGAQRISADFIVESLCALGISGLKEPESIRTPLVVRDGRGWRAEVDLPAGVTAAAVMAKRENLAAALGRPLGSVWPECDTATSPGRLVIWVGDFDLAAVPQGTWPLASANKIDIFNPFAFGENAKGDVISMCLAETNMLIGAIPGAGKTTSLRNVLLASVLDPRTELWIWEFKGTGDFEALAPLATRYGSGPDDDTIESAMEGLRALRRECAKRAQLIKDLGDSAPDHKVTSELANRRGLHPLVVAIDEAQELFRDAKCGKEAGELAEQIIKLGRALGVILLIATQRPDRDSLPTGISANVGTRFCLRVVDHISNDMILGTSSHQRGVKATAFTKRDRGMGYLVGQHDEPQIVRVFNVDAVTTEFVVNRALAMRGPIEREERQLTQLHTVEDLEELHGVSVLLDVRDAIEEAGHNLWWDELAARLHVDIATLQRELKEFDVTSKDIFRRVDGKGMNRKGVRLADVTKALEATK